MIDNEYLNKCASWANKIEEALNPLFDFLYLHGISKHDFLSNSISHDSFIAICYTCFLRSYKPRYEFYIHTIFGIEYLRSELIFNIEFYGNVTVFRNERIDGNNIINSLAIPLSLKESNRVILPNDIDAKIEDIVKQYAPQPKENNIQQPVYYSTSTKNKMNNAKKVCYIMIDSKTKYVKIGNSINPHKRERTLQAEKPTIELLHVFNENIESELHKKYSDKRVRGEWFSLTKTEVKNIIKHYERI